MRPLLLAVLLACATLAALPAGAAPVVDRGRELSLLLRKLDRTARILYVTAHPDDEDAGLLARLGHGEGIELGLLTLTRGEGGQNEIGTELFHALGVLRSRELEAAGRHLGVTQFFSRAYEFGYSFSVEETFEKWGEEAILRDIVAVVRGFRPDVILTMNPAGAGGGQHHQASARLAARAFHVAADDRWPELGTPHETRRLFHQLGDDDDTGGGPVTELPLDGYDPVLGASYAEIGARARAEHKCQGMARIHEPFPERVSRWRLAIGEGDPRRHFFEGLQEPIPASLSELAARARADHRPENPAVIVEPLLEILSLVREAPGDRLRLETIEARAARAAAIALGVRVEGRSATARVAPGDSLRVTVAAENDGVRPLAIRVRLLGPGVATDVPLGRLAPGARVRRFVAIGIDPAATPTLPVPVPEDGRSLSAHEAARFRESAWHAFEIESVIDVDGVRLTPPRERVEAHVLDPAFPSVRLADPAIVPDPSVRSAREVVPLALNGEAAQTSLTLLVSRLGGGDLDVRLEAPAGWAGRIEPRRVRVTTRAGGEETPARFRVRAREGAGAAELVAVVSVPGTSRESRSGYRPIRYPHIRPDALFAPAIVRVVPFPCVVPDGVRVGYVEGSGDRTFEALETLRLAPARLSRADLLEGDLERFDVIVTGVRAYKVREDLKDAHRRLLAWIERGGVLIVQYNKFELNDGSEGASPFTPFPARVGRQRVTVESAPIVVNAPDHPVFTSPNSIGPSDWAGWVQERGLYFLDLDDARYRDLVTMEDPVPYNAGPKGGALVEARLGEGRWLYVGIGLFRQLPAGVPGAYRLLANLVALGTR